MIEIKNLTKRFGNSVVVNNLSLTIRANDRIALIGPNGAGKTTLIRAILGHYVFEGEIRVFGLNPRTHRAKILERIGYVPQLPPPLQMNVGELVRFSAAILPNIDLSSIYEQAELLGLKLQEIRKTPFVKLSGGMKQKLMIALALAKKPKLLIMDEPTANLDHSGRNAFLAQLHHHSKDTTMLLSSHRVDEVLRLINRVVEMDHGEVVKDEPVFQGPGSERELTCQVVLTEANKELVAVLRDWRFWPKDGGLEFVGQVPGSRRLEFMRALSNYAKYVRTLNIS